MWEVFAGARSTSGPTHRDVGSVRWLPGAPADRPTGMWEVFAGCREHQRTDPQGCGKCSLVPGAPADRPTGMWEVHPWISNCSCIAGIPSIHGSMPAIAPALQAFRPSMDQCLQLLLHCRHSVHPWTSKTSAPAGADASESETALRAHSPSTRSCRLDGTRTRRRRRRIHRRLHDATRPDRQSPK